MPRLCGSCQSPLARQEDTCWRCGTQWVTEEQPQPTLRAIPGGARTPLPPAFKPRIAAAVLATDADRWDNEGGHFDDDMAVRLRPTAGSR
jgi:hypothetical protein